MIVGKVPHGMNSEDHFTVDYRLPHCTLAWLHNLNDSSRACRLLATYIADSQAFSYLGQLGVPEWNVGVLLLQRCYYVPQGTQALVDALSLL
jgi:hypothetical protein